MRHLHPEDGSGMFHRNVFYKKHAVIISRKTTFSNTNRAHSLSTGSPINPPVAVIGDISATSCI
jgi:hypothetical protein